MMKKIKSLAAVCCVLALFTACENSEPIDNSNGINTDQNDGNSNSGNDTDQNGGNSNSDNSSGSVSAPTGTENGHGYVDLGLSVKWATCNVGATKPEEYGNYYAWGETEPKTTYNWSTYKWCNGSSSTLTKYNTSSDYGTVDDKTVLELADDAARTNWGGQWRMPTDAEWGDLYTYCTWTWTTFNGMEGYIVKSNINNKSIFLPAACDRGYDDLDVVGNYGHYWNSNVASFDSNMAWSILFDLGEVYGGTCLRCYGLSVRPVL